MSTLDVLAIIAGLAFVWLFYRLMLHAGRGTPKPKRSGQRRQFNWREAWFMFWWN